MIRFSIVSAVVAIATALLVLSKNDIARGLASGALVAVIFAVAADRREWGGDE